MLPISHGRSWQLVHCLQARARGPWDSRVVLGRAAVRINSYHVPLMSSLSDGQYASEGLVQTLSTSAGATYKRVWPCGCWSTLQDCLDECQLIFASWLLNVLGPVPGVDVMAKRSQGWVKCEDRLPYYTEIAPARSLPLPRLHADHNSTTREDLAAGAGAPGVKGPLEWGSWGFNAARGRCSGQLRSKKMTRASHLWTK
jgi:hypothetical protein